MSNVLQTTNVPLELGPIFGRHIQTIPGMTSADAAGNVQALYAFVEAADGTITVSRPDTVDPAAVASAAQATLDESSAQQTATTNASNLRQKAQQALTTNATFLALSPPTNAQIAAQVNALTKECSALIRLVIQQLDTTAGT